MATFYGNNDWRDYLAHSRGQWGVHRRSRDKQISGSDRSGKIYKRGPAIGSGPVGSTNRKEDPNKKRRPREKNVTSTNSSGKIYRRGSALGGGPVGRR